MNVHLLSAEALHENFINKTLSATEIAEAFLAHIDQHNTELNSLLIVDRDGALAQATALDAALEKGESLGPLAGVPVLVKDTVCTKDLRTTAASKILADFIPTYDATIVSNMKRDGAIILGKTNLDEFAMGSSNENSAFGDVKNPWNVACTPGGSSGGTAAGIAARFAPLGIGSDTGGSIRQPASFCGIVGLKPTYGRVSRFGLLAFASSFDQLGPMTHTVRDSALFLNSMAGHDTNDHTSSREAVPNYLDSIEEPITKMRVGVPTEFLTDDLDPEVRASFEAVVEKLKSEHQVEVVELSLPHTRFGIPAYYIVATAEASSNLSRYDGVRYGHRTEEPGDLDELYAKSRAEGFGDEVKRRIMLGTFALSAGYFDAYYDKALRVRRLVKQDFDAAFEKVDVIIGPTSPFATFELGSKIDDPLQMYLCDALTVTANLAGIPAISVPCGFTTDKRPIGFQITGNYYDEATILQVARSVEKVCEIAQEIPAMIAN